MEIEKKEQYWVEDNHFDTETEAKKFRWKEMAKRKLIKILDISMPVMIRADPRPIASNLENAPSASPPSMHRHPSGVWPIPGFWEAHSRRSIAG